MNRLATDIFDFDDVPMIEAVETTPRSTLGPPPADYIPGQVPRRSFWWQEWPPEGRTPCIRVQIREETAEIRRIVPRFAPEVRWPCDIEGPAR